jgi:hypothetical protein
MPQSRKAQVSLIDTPIVCPEFSIGMECLNEPRVYLKSTTELAEANPFVTLSGCADS